jgi:hypothetical protein
MRVAPAEVMAHRLPSAGIVSARLHPAPTILAATDMSV